MTINIKSLKAYKCFNYQSQISLSLTLRTAVFELQASFETTPHNDPKMTLNSKMSNVPHTQVITIPESQISLHSALWPDVFELQNILEQLH